MKAIIPVAGKGTRMRPHTFAHPKVLLPVAGKPMISYIIDNLVQNNVTDIIFIIGYMGEQIEEFIKKKYLSINSYFVNQEEMLGLGHAISLAENLVDEDEEVFIVLGDTLFEVDFAQMLSTKYSNLGVKHVEDPSRFGVAVVEKGFITHLVEKPKEPVSNLALVGLYYIKESNLLFESIREIIQNDIRTKGEYQLTDALQIMIRKGAQFVPFEIDGWYDCGKPETLLETTFIMLDKGRDNSSTLRSYENCIIIPPVFIAQNVTISNSIIGPYVSIGENAVINDSIIKKSILGESVEIKNTIMETSILGNFAVLKNRKTQVNMGDYSKIEQEN